MILGPNPLLFLPQLLDFLDRATNPARNVRECPTRKNSGGPIHAKNPAPRGTKSHRGFFSQGKTRTLRLSNSNGETSQRSFIKISHAERHSDKQIVYDACFCHYDLRYHLRLYHEVSLRI